MKHKPTSRNHIARANRLVNRPRVERPRKGKGSYSRKKQGDRDVSY